MAFRREKDNTEITLEKELRKVFLSHLVGIFIVFVVFFFFFLSLWTIKYVNTVMGYLMLMVYVLTLASAGNKCAVWDKRSYTLTKPHPLKGLLLALSIVVSNMVFYGIWQFAWTLDSKALNVAGQLVFVAWSLPYNSFLQLVGAEMGLLGKILMIVVPFVSVGAGYFAGYCNWDIYEKLDKIVFEKKNNQL